jgi:hypothetical protein
LSPITGAPTRIARSITAEDGEILREQKHRPPVDTAVAGHDAVAIDPLCIEPEVGAAMRDESVELDEAPFVHQEVDPLARRELPLRVLRRGPLLTATPLGFRAAALEQFQLVAHGHGREK